MDEFPEYAVKYSKQAAESKAALPPEMLATVDEIVNGALALDPLTPRAQIIPASRDGKTFIYDNNDKERYAKSHVPTAKWVDFKDVKKSDLPQDHSRKLVFYCANEH